MGYRSEVQFLLTTYPDISYVDLVTRIFWDLGKRRPDRYAAKSSDEGVVVPQEYGALQCILDPSSLSVARSVELENERAKYKVNAFLLSHDWIKWYIDCDRAFADAIESLIEQRLLFGYKFVRIGEELDDAEESCTDDEIYHESKYKLDLTRVVIKAKRIKKIKHNANINHVALEPQLAFIHQVDAFVSESIGLQRKIFVNEHTLLPKKVANARLAARTSRKRLTAVSRKVLDDLDTEHGLDRIVRSDAKTAIPEQLACLLPHLIPAGPRTVRTNWTITNGTEILTVEKDGVRVSVLSFPADPHATVPCDGPTKGEDDGTDLLVINGVTYVVNGNSPEVYAKLDDIYGGQDASLRRLLQKRLVQKTF